MAWSFIRKATVEDEARLAQAERRFVERHNLRTGWGDEVSDSECLDAAITAMYGENEQDKAGRLYMRKLWLGCVHRALQHPRAEGIAWGCVGFWVD